MSSPTAVIVVPLLIHIEETSRSRGVISQESPEPGYIMVSLTVLVPNPIPAPSTFFSLELSPHFSHPHGICRHISTTPFVEDPETEPRQQGKQTPIDHVDKIPIPSQSHLCMFRRSPCIDSTA